MTTILRFGVVAFLALVAAPHMAHAHAVLLGSTPKASEVLGDSPKELTLNFNENVGPIFFKVLDKTGQEAGKPGEIRLDGNNLHMSLGEVLPNGTYVLTYRVVSADTHPVGATFMFSVGEPIAAASEMKAQEAGAASGWTKAVAVNRWVLYTAMLMAAGAALFTLGMTVPPAASEANARLGRTAAIIAALSYILSIGLGGAEMVMGGVDVLFSPKAWSQGGGTTLLPSAFIGLPAMGILFMAFLRRTTSTLMIGTVLAIASFLVTGHAATAVPVWVMAPMVAIHLACAAFWLGALRPLYVTTRSGSVQDAGAAMTQFSHRAVVTVAALFLSGVVLSCVQVENFKAFLSTDYGMRLRIKILLFVVLLAFAAYNKLVLTPALEKADVKASARLRRSIFVEYILYVLILGAAMSLTLTSPPRALNAQGTPTAMTQQDRFKATTTAEGYSAEIDVTPGKTGENMMMVTVKGKDGEVLTLESMDMTLALPAAGISQVEKKGQAAGPMWHFMVGETIIPGEWEIKASAFVNAFDKIDFEFKVPIK